jgi:hypothetical protein
LKRKECGKREVYKTETLLEEEGRKKNKKRGEQKERTKNNGKYILLRILTSTDTESAHNVTCCNENAHCNLL